MTLIEVVAATALMGTLLAGCLVGFRTHRQQLLVADAKLQAVQSLDLLMADFFQSPQKYAIARAGNVPDREDLVWVMSVQRAAIRNTDFDLIQLRFDVFDRRRMDRSLASVEVVVPASAIVPPQTGE